MRYSLRYPLCPDTERYVSRQQIELIIIGLLKQAVEKMDRVRECAGMIIQHLIHLPSILPYIPHHQELVTVIPSSTFDWSSPSLTFPLLTPLLSYPLFTVPLLRGLFISVGGLSESVVRCSSESLLCYISGLDESELHSLGLLVVEQMLIYKGQAKLIIPILKALEILFNAGAFSLFQHQHQHQYQHQYPHQYHSLPLSIPVYVKKCYIVRISTSY